MVDPQHAVDRPDHPRQFLPFLKVAWSRLGGDRKHFLETKHYQQGHHLSDLAIVENIYLLNSFYAVTLATTIPDFAIYYFQFWKPFWEAKSLQDQKVILRRQNHYSFRCLGVIH